jgi:hypothetical protein
MQTEINIMNKAQLKSYLKETDAWNGVAKLKVDDLKRYAALVGALRESGSDESMSLARVEHALDESGIDAVQILKAYAEAMVAVAVSEAPVEADAPTEVIEAIEKPVRAFAQYHRGKDKSSKLAGDIVKLLEANKEPVETSMLVSLLGMNPKCRHASFWTGGRRIVKDLANIGYQGKITRTKSDSGVVTTLTLLELP